MVKVTDNLLKNFQWSAGALLPEVALPLGEEMHQAISKEVSRRLGKEYPFCPWMSDVEKAEQLESHMGREYLGEIQTNPFTLMKLQKDLQGENGYLHFGFDEGLNIKIDPEFAKRQPNFEKRFYEARALLFQLLPWIQPIYQKLVKEVLPVISESEVEFDRVGASTHAAKGALLFMFAEENRVYAKEQIAIDLAHEIGHQVLQVYLSCDRLISSDQTAMVYSGARDDDREAIRSFHGCIAHVYESITAVALRENDTNGIDGARPFLDYTICDLDRRFRKSLKGLREHCQFTELGEKLMQEFEQYSQRLAVYISENIRFSNEEMVSFFEEAVSE